MTLNTSFRDLEIAEDAIDRMARATKFPVFNEAWQDFLFRCERAWEQTERAIKKEKGFQQWIKPYRDLHKKDPLIRFLRQARHAETHAISPTLDKPLEFVIKDKIGRPFTMDSLDVSFKEGTLTINMNTLDVLHDWDLSILPTDPRLLRFKNRSKWYNPPKSHLGNQLKDMHPVIAAKLGLQFYRGFVVEANARFFNQVEG